MAVEMPTIIRGTTPIHTFDVEIDLTTAEEIYITYRQSKSRIVEKTLEDITVAPDKLTVRLTQADTLAFSTSGEYVQIQVRVVLPGGTSMASDILYASVSPVLKDGEI